MIQWAARHGYVGAASDYRQISGHDAHWPDQFEDAVHAVRWLRAHARDYSIDPDGIAVQGFSSGAHLALLLAFADESDLSQIAGDFGDPRYSSRVRACVNRAGPVDMFDASPGIKSDIASFIGISAEDNPEPYRAAGPLSYVGADDPPVLSIYNNSDTTVSLHHAEILDNATREAGVTHLLTVLPGSHGAITAEAFDRIAEFLHENLVLNVE